MNNTVAILSTGNEVVAGDIQNSNTRDIAQRLKDANIRVAIHMAVNDIESDIISALHYLKQQCSAIIVTGGLGPTSDDRTRFALSALCDQELFFDQGSWDHIQQIFSKFNKPVPEINRQQCYFPKEASIITNTQGTANACRFDWQDTTFFLLPGPPRECLPIVDDVVLPQLIERGYASFCVRLNYLLLGVGESDIADKIEPYFSDGTDVELGYRASFPYIQVKLSAVSESALASMRQLIEPIIAPYLVSDSGRTATEQLVAMVEQLSYSVCILDRVSYGRWQSHLVTPATNTQLRFSEELSSTCQIILSGIDLITSPHSEKLMYTLKCQLNDHTVLYEYQAPRRGIRTLNSVVEWASWKALTFLTEHG
ncbi:MAG: hypothetical protein CL816_02380 [Coxiellaceae bacterium]|nr:hypothetical protein [Coxiellaceae bacterium]|tara:strand:+ start:12487 stop:13590 length:1104 start_codon:yes stop_codon:yes gene_type:complete